MLTPLFTGLFGAPVLVEALDGGGVPEQIESAITLSRRFLGGLGVVGTVWGAVVGYIPGVSSAVAATLALVAVPGRYGNRGFIVATSGVNTAKTVFALFALVALGSPERVCWSHSNRRTFCSIFPSCSLPLDSPPLLGSYSCC